VAAASFSIARVFSIKTVDYGRSGVRLKAFPVTDARSRRLPFFAEARINFGYPGTDANVSDQRHTFFLYNGIVLLGQSRTAEPLFMLFDATDPNQGKTSPSRSNQGPRQQPRTTLSGKTTFINAHSVVNRKSLRGPPLPALPFSRLALTMRCFPHLPASNLAVPCGFEF